MKRAITFLFVLVAMSTPAFSDGFYSVHSPNGFDVWAVGNSGLVFRSYDGGVTWSSFTQGSATLRSVYTYNSHVWIVGDNGVCYSSTDGGTTWNTQTLGGGVTLRSITFTSPSTGWIAGDNGTILETSDGGATWDAKVSNTSQPLYAIVFVDSQIGYAAGSAGTLLKTTDAGVNWTNIAPGEWTKNILSLSASGSTLYASGVDEFCFKSTDAGTTWNGLNFKTDSRSDVNAVFAVSPTNAYFAGGGGFIRTSTDGGVTFNYGIHQMHAKLNGVFFYDANNGWACGEKNNAVLRTTDGGQTWQLPQGTTVNHQWQQKFSVSSSIGNTFCVNPWNKNVIYVVMGSTIYMSTNRGDVWSQTATISTGGSTWSFYVSPRDTNIWVAATSGGGKGVRRTTDRGATWTTTLLRNFTSYGMPLEMDPDHPDTLVFAAEGTGSGPDGILYISSNFGATWDTLARTSFRSPCDVIIVPANTNLWYVGDGVTGSGQAQMWRSTDYGKSWTSIYSSSSSEIPMIAVSRLRNNHAFATTWSGPSYRKSTNSGLTWVDVAPTTSTWGTDIAKDDPNVVAYGRYGGSPSYLSTDGGVNFSSIPLMGSNSGMLAYDRATFLVHQASAGVWKCNIIYTVPVNNVQTVTLLSPNGGESWPYNSVRNITWNANSIGNVKLEYRTAPAAPWQVIAPSVLASLGTYAWTIPNTPTSQARVRISDVSDGNPVDSSNADFSITAASITITPTSLDFGEVPVGTFGVDTLRITNSGTTALVISSVTTDTRTFEPGRTSFSIPAGVTDTLTVLFAPSQVRSYQDTIRIVNNTPDSPWNIPVSGIGGQPLDIAQEPGLPKRYLLEQNYPNPFNPSTTISFDLPKESHVTLKVYNVLGQQVALLADGFYQAGRFRVLLDATHLPSGLYIYRLHANELSSDYTFADTKRLVLLK